MMLAGKRLVLPMNLAMAWHDVASSKNTKVLTSAIDAASPKATKFIQTRPDGRFRMLRLAWRGPLGLCDTDHIEGLLNSRGAYVSDLSRHSAVDL
jgi:hypothetical protein